jgi:hypothetical protein
VTESSYQAGTCNIGPGEINRRRTVAIIGIALSLISVVSFVTTGAPRGARLAVFFPLMLASIGWVQSRRKFCLAYGFMGTFNFGKLGQISKVSDPQSRSADRKTALSILFQATLYAAIATGVVVALPLT